MASEVPLFEEVTGCFESGGNGSFVPSGRFGVFDWRRRRNAFFCNRPRSVFRFDAFVPSGNNRRRFFLNVCFGFGRGVLGVVVRGADGSDRGVGIVSTIDVWKYARRKGEGHAMQP